MTFYPEPIWGVKAYQLGLGPPCPQEGLVSLCQVGNHSYLQGNDGWRHQRNETSGFHQIPQCCRLAIMEMKGYFLSLFLFHRENMTFRNHNAQILGFSCTNSEVLPDCSFPAVNVRAISTSGICLKHQPCNKFLCLTNARQAHYRAIS